MDSKRKKDKRHAEESIRISTLSGFYYFLLSRLDNQIDCFPPPQWKTYGAARLGDTACEFLEKFFTRQIVRDEIPRFLRFQYPGAQEQGRSDLYQQLNLFCMNLTKISSLASAYLDSPSAARREAYVEADRQLHVLCAVCIFNKPQEVAAIIREGDKQGKGFEAIYKDLTVHFPAAYFDGMRMKKERDIAKWAQDLRMEVEHGSEGFVKPNRVLKELQSKKVDFRALYNELKEYFSENRPIPYNKTSEVVRYCLESCLSAVDQPMRSNYQFATKRSDVPGKVKTLSRRETLGSNFNTLLMGLPQISLKRDLFR